MSKYYSSSIAFGAKQTKTEKVVVSPTKIGDVTTDAVSGALTVDEVPTLDSLNPVSSDGVARAVIQAGAELPTRSSEDTGKVLTVKNSDGDLEWDEPAEELPAVTSTDDGKVLTASYSGGQGSYSWQTAQSGAEYVSAPGVRVSGNVIDVNIRNGLEYEPTGTAQASTIGVYYEEYSETLDVFDRIVTLDLTLCHELDKGAIKVIEFYNHTIISRPGDDDTLYVAFAIVPLENGSVPGTPSSKLVFNYVQDKDEGFDGATLSLGNLTAESNLDWATVEANPSNYALVLMQSDSSGSTSETMYIFSDDGPAVNAATMLYADSNAFINVTTPIPKPSQADAGRILAVDENGYPRWEIHELGTVTSIQKVNSLPASPVSSVLYLIPET